MLSGDDGTWGEGGCDAKAPSFPARPLWGHLHMLCAEVMGIHPKNDEVVGREPPEAQIHAHASRPAWARALQATGRAADFACPASHLLRIHSCVLATLHVVLLDTEPQSGATHSLEKQVLGLEPRSLAPGVPRIPSCVEPMLPSRAGVHL